MMLIGHNAVLEDDAERERVDGSMRSLGYHSMREGQTHTPRAKQKGPKLRNLWACEVEESEGVWDRGLWTRWWANGGSKSLVTSHGGRRHSGQCVHEFWGESTAIATCGEGDKEDRAQGYGEPAWMAENARTKPREDSAGSENEWGHTKGPLCQIPAISDDSSLLQRSPRKAEGRECEVEKRAACGAARRRTRGCAATKLGTYLRRGTVEALSNSCSDPSRS